MRKSIFFGFLFLLLFCSLFLWQDVVELLGEEPRRAIIALEMQMTGDYLVPRINGMEYYNKPPLFNWIMASFFTMTGSAEEWVVRMPSLAGWILMTVLLYFVVRRHLGKEAALLSALFTLTAADVYFYAAVFSGEIDLFYSLIVFAQVIALFWFHQQKKLFWMFAVSYALAGLGFLTKGFPSAAFQVLTLLGMAIIYKKWRWLFTWQHVAGILCFLLPAGIYYYLYSQEADHAKYLFNLVKEASQRSGLESNPPDLFLNIIKFPADIIKVLLPWSLLMVFFIQKQFKRILLSNELLTFAVIFLIFNLPVYWLTGELRNRYLYMFVPFFMVIIAYFYLSYNGQFPKFRQWTDTIFSVFICIIPLLFLVPLFLPQTRSIPFYWVKSIILFAAGVASVVFYFYRWNDLRIYTVVMGMILLRVGINVFYLPAYQLNDKFVYYEKVSHEITSITGSEKIYFAGTTQQLDPQLRIGKSPLLTLHFVIPEYIPFQLTYYIERNTGEVLRFTSEPEAGIYCIGRESFFDRAKCQELYRYYDRRAKENFLLVRINP
ncbi:MAG: glycosyltransferase family 39 protein [Bacteroidales bacterium]|nr:glycosyltransferase family 39 protein [Bacteroidales bacterium]